MNFSISEEVLNQILAYLGKCPYNEVSSIINNVRLTVTPINASNPEPTTQPQPEGGADNVQSTEAESTQSQTTDEGGKESNGEESQNSEQQG